MQIEAIKPKTKDDINVNVSSSQEKGDSLELAIEHIFKAAGFKTERNVVIAKYQVDVRANIGDRTIIIECKNYQNSNLIVRNLIHQWNSKNQLIKAHKTIIAIAGIKLKSLDFELASEFDVELWSQEDISDLFNLSLQPERLRKRLLEKISFKPLTIAERYREDITYLVIKPLLSKLTIAEETLYHNFNKWLRAYILTELQMVATSKELRERHIELFEGTKTRKGFLNISKKRKEVDYWNAVLDKLTTSDILPGETQECYLKHMNSLVKEYNAQTTFFNSDDFLAKTRRLILSRLKNAILLDQFCSFTTYSMNHTVRVGIISEDNYLINVTSINEKQGNILNWILTTQYQAIYKPATKTYEYYWFCNSFTETAEKVYRIFTEFYQITPNEKIRDMSLK